MKRIEIYENGINIVFEITDDNEVSFCTSLLCHLMRQKPLHTWG